MTSIAREEPPQLGRSLDELEIQYLNNLTNLGVPIFAFTTEDRYPNAWSESTVQGNKYAIRSGRALAALMGHADLVAIDVDTKNGASLQDATKSLTDAGVKIRALIKTPSLGFQLLVSGPADTPTLHAYEATKDRPRVDALIGLPGVEVIAFGGNIGLPAERINARKWQEYTQAPYNIEEPHYEVIFDDLEEIVNDDPSLFVEWLETNKVDRERPDYKHKKVVHDLVITDYTIQSRKRLQSYAEAALYDQAMELSKLDIGGRNNFLNSSACKVYHYEWILGSDVIESWLSRAAQDSGLEADEIKDTLDSGYRASIYEQWLPKIADFELETLAEKKARRVEYHMIELEAKEEANRQYALSHELSTQRFEITTLESLLELPDEPTDRVFGVAPWDAFSLVVGQAKSGKTTFALNMAYSLLTGEDFLGLFPVVPIASDAKIAMLNYEVSWALIRKWAVGIGIDPARFITVNLRGVRNPLLHREDRYRLAKELRDNNVETLLVDPFANAFTGKNQNDADEVKSFYAELNMFSKAEVCAKDLILTAHSGYNQTHVRGSSALLDGPDCITTIIYDEKSDARHFTSKGRTNDLDRHWLFMPNPETFVTTAASQDMEKAKSKTVESNAMTTAVLEIVSKAPGCTATTLTDAMTERGFKSFKNVRSRLLQKAVDDLQLVKVDRANKHGGPMFYLPADAPHNP